MRGLNWNFLSQNIVPLVCTVSLELFSHVHQRHFKEYAGYVEYEKSLSCLLKSWSASSRDSKTVPTQTRHEVANTVRSIKLRCSERTKHRSFICIKAWILNQLVHVINLSTFIGSNFALCDVVSFIYNWQFWCRPDVIPHLYIKCLCNKIQYWILAHTFLTIKLSIPNYKPFRTRLIRPRVSWTKGGILNSQ